MPYLTARIFLSGNVSQALFKESIINSETFLTGDRGKYLSRED